MKKLFKILTLSALVSTQLDFIAFAENYYSQPSFQDLKIDVGTWLGSNVLDKNYYSDNAVKKIFQNNEKLRSKLDKDLPSDFSPIVKSIHNYIEANTSRNIESINGISNSELSKKIVRASFCFGTDPKMIAAKIRIESVFKRNAVSPTGAVGLTQMTQSAIEEVNDQLGNRGPKFCPAVNAVYFKKAIRCYLGKDMTTAWDDGIIKKGANLSKASLNSIKKWIVKNLDRDLIYGQILLKVNLASTRDAKNTMLQNYSLAFAKYNGDTQKIKGVPMKQIYAKKVLDYYQKVSYEVNNSLDFHEAQETFDNMEIDPSQLQQRPEYLDI